MMQLKRFLFRSFARLLAPSFALLPISKLGFLKTAILRMHGCKVGNKCSFSPRIFILRGENVSIGDRCNIGIDCRLIDINTITLGCDVLISHNVTMISGDHHNLPGRPPKDGPIIIADNVWIGASVTIVGPVEIGAGAIIGANSFVRTDVPQNAIFAGSPARQIG